jgi:CRISPR-associated protein Cas2
MAEGEFLFVISYDVTDDRRRRRLARVLEKQAVRVQQSVFEIRAPWAKAIALAGRARRHLAADDSLRMYAIDRIGRQRSRVFGPGPRVEDSAFYLL